MRPSECKLLNLLSNHNVTFFIPPYQRNYEWSEDQCKVFLEDVEKTCRLNKSGTTAEHFFGTITYFATERVFNQPDRLVLIDGQQRITTTMLFLIALRDLSTDEDVKKFIDSKYLKNDNVRSDTDYKIKLKQVVTDWAAYKKVVLSEELDDADKITPVYHNYRFFYNKLTEFVANGGDLMEIVEKGLSKFSVITIELEPERNAWENPQEIFESMNSLGKPLSLADLVRNYLLLGLNPDKQNDLYERYWLHIEKNVPGRVSDFIRDYMQAREVKPFVKSTEQNYKELYGAFKRVFAQDETEDLLKSLAECSKMYSYIIEGGKSGEADIDRELKDLNTMGVTTAYSFLMSLLRAWKTGDFTAKEISDILNAFRIYIMRRRILGLTTAENKNFPLLVGKIQMLKDASDKKLAMFQILADQENSMRLPNDVELRHYIETMNFYNFKHCKLYLSMIEESLTRSRPDQNDPNLQIEHIMPKTLNDQWRTELGPDYESIHFEFINNIGNLTLIRHNRELSNKPFEEKKKIYTDNAGLQIAKTGITNKANWGKINIKARAKWLIVSLLNDVLPIPDSMRKTNNFRVKAGKHLSFQDLQIIGDVINFIGDPSIIARVVSDKSVEFEGKRWKLSPLTREIQTRKGRLTASGSYQGAQYWEYDGIKLADIM